MISTGMIGRPTIPLSFVIEVGRIPSVWPPPYRERRPAFARAAAATTTHHAAANATS
jgi:hypothetical protein